MRSYLTIRHASAAVAVLATTTFAHANSLTPQEMKLAEAAKKEGAVTILNPIFSDRTGERLQPPPGPAAKTGPRRLPATQRVEKYKLHDVSTLDLCSFDHGRTAMEG